MSNTSDLALLTGEILFMDPLDSFEQEVATNISNLKNDIDLQALSRIWVREISRHRWAYNFQWMGRPIIQFPNDAWAMQEIIWKTKPDLIIETGIAHGGSLIFSAAMLAFLDMCEALELGTTFDPKQSKRKVVGVDIDIRVHNRKAVEEHPMSSRIEMIQGSSISPVVAERVSTIAKSYDRIMVCLDSNHSHDHVLSELEIYAPLTSIGSYCVVLDTLVEDMPGEFFENRPWGPGNSPKTAVHEYLQTHPEFKIDKSIDYKLLISVAPDGYLRRIA